MLMMKLPPRYEKPHYLRYVLPSLLAAHQGRHGLLIFRRDCDVFDALGQVLYYPLLAMFLSSTSTSLQNYQRESHACARLSHPRSPRLTILYIATSASLILCFLLENCQDLSNRSIRCLLPIMCLLIIRQNFKMAVRPVACLVFRM